MPRGTVTQTGTFVYDSTTQRLMSATHPESGAVTFTYNNDGTVATKIDAKGQKVSYGYDSLQRPTGITVYPNGVTADPCQGVTTYYDANPDDSGKPVPFTQNAAARVAMVMWGGSACAGGYTYHEAFSYSSAGKVEKQAAERDQEVDAAGPGRGLHVQHRGAGDIGEVSVVGR